MHCDLQVSQMKVQVQPISLPQCCLTHQHSSCDQTPKRPGSRRCHDAGNTGHHSPCRAINVKPFSLQPANLQSLLREPIHCVLFFIFTHLRMAALLKGGTELHRAVVPFCLDNRAMHNYCIMSLSLDACLIKGQ